MQYRTNEGGSTKKRNVAGGDSTETTLIQLKDNTTNYIEVAAANSAGTGEYSKSIAVITDSKSNCM